MIIILDSNIFIADFHMTGNNFKLLIDFLNRTDSKLAIPKVIELEVIHNFANEIRETQDKIQRDIRSLIRRIGSVTVENPLTDDWVSQEYKQYCKVFDKKLTEIGAIRLEYPNISHQTIIERAVRKKKPFKQNGDGYRDTLIWETVLELLANQEREIVLVTRNTKDFCTNINNIYYLHNDLEIDIVEQGIPKNKLSFFSDLKMFLEDKILPNLEKHEKLKESIIQRKYPFEDLDNIIYSKLVLVLNDVNSDINELYFEKEFEEPRLLKVNSSGILQVGDIRKISQDEIYISLELFSTATFEGLVKKRNFNIDNHYSYFYQSDNNSMYFEVAKMKKLNINLNMIFSTQMNSIISVEIENVE